jgi:hypothetical protein
MLVLVLLAALFVSEPRGQEYALEHGDPVLFWIPDEQPPRYGTCFYLWGYYPVIYGPRGMIEFRDVEWICGAQ